MRLLTKILSFLMLLVLLTAENCGDNRGVNSKEETLNSVFQDIEEKFAETELSDEILAAFEKRAIQKLQDISDYINIYADTSLSLEFRAQAKQMIQENFFENHEEKIFYKNLKIVEDTLNTVLYFLKYGGSFKIDINSIEITNHFQKESGLKYKGEIQFTQEIYSLNPADTAVSATNQRQINMLAIKTKKNFGDKTEDVWELFLGEIKF